MLETRIVVKLFFFMSHLKPSASWVGRRPTTVLANGGFVHLCPYMPSLRKLTRKSKINTLVLLALVLPFPVNFSQIGAASTSGLPHVQSPAQRSAAFCIFYCLQFHEKGKRSSVYFFCNRNWGIIQLSTNSNFYSFETTY